MQVMHSLVMITTVAKFKLFSNCTTWLFYSMMDKGWSEHCELDFGTLQLPQPYCNLDTFTLISLSLLVGQDAKAE